MKLKKELTVIIERDEDGYFVGSVPELKGCHTQAKSLDELIERIKERRHFALKINKNIVNDTPHFYGEQLIYRRQDYYHRYYK